MDTLQYCSDSNAYTVNKTIMVQYNKAQRIQPQIKFDDVK